MNLYVVRHGETIWNKERKVQGITDIPLTDKGREEAYALQELIKNLNIDVVISSPLERARETAKILVNSKLPINTDDRINGNIQETLPNIIDLNEKDIPYS